MRPWAALASPSMVKINSKSVMWSRRLLPVFTTSSPLSWLCSPGGTPKVARAISAVSIEYSLPSATPRAFHSSVSSPRTEMERSRFSIHACG